MAGAPRRPGLLLAGAGFSKTRPGPGPRSDASGYSSPVELEKRAERRFVNETENDISHTGSKCFVCRVSVCVCPCVTLDILELIELTTWSVVTCYGAMDRKNDALQFIILIFF